jgi:hypothetical protein
MTGRRITKQQVEIYMTSRLEKHTQITSSAKAGISERSGRNMESGKQTASESKARHWRTRPDPLEAVWENDLLPLLEKTPSLQAITLLEHIQFCYPGLYPDKILRTLQRRTKQWQALHGPEKEVMFRQTHIAGQQGLSDFTRLKKVLVTISGDPFNHLLYHFRLAFSHWSHIKVIEGGESYTALAEGLQEALKRLGGAPYEHRTDSLSASFKNMTKEAQDDITCRYDALCKQFSMLPTRNNRGEGHENGSVESAHGHVKRRIKQALLLRGSNDFPHVAAYQEFIDNVVVQHNRRNAKAVTEERSALQPLPIHKAVDYTEICVVVSSSSTIDVRRVTYTVPSRLQDETLHVHLYDNRLVCYLGHVQVIELKRLHPKGGARGRLVNYRHVIHSLVKKPQAFRNSTLCKELLPNLDYHAIWHALDTQLPPKEACKMMVGLLHIAANEDCEEELARWVLALLDENKPISLSRLQCHFKKSIISIPEVVVAQHSLAHYNLCIPSHEETANV